MLERQKRLNEVYNYLHSNKGIQSAKHPLLPRRSNATAAPIIRGRSSVRLVRHR